ncbi:lysoplasmalogenase [Actinoplanes sp. CA-142083]|uniref:lysoplasmalogenase n=1 Tax=Actinoplanes sp. CA-142083 TaxID=3239903 RepID=UPI003D91C6C6
MNPPTRIAPGGTRLAAGHGELSLRLFALAAIVELVAVAAEWTPVQWVAKPLLAPLLIWALGRRDLVVLALCFATAGDIALLVPGQAAFLVGMVFFLGCQICLTVAFLRHGRPPAAPVIGAALVWAVANSLLWGQLGALRVPVLLYSVALAAMAAAAAGVSRQVAVGGVLFLISDLTIGLGGPSLLVMATYVAALYLIVTGWAGRRLVPREAEAAPV